MGQTMIRFFLIISLFIVPNLYADTCSVVVKESSGCTEEQGNVGYVISSYDYETGAANISGPYNSNAGQEICFTRIQIWSNIGLGGQMIPVGSVQTGTFYDHAGSIPQVGSNGVISGVYNMAPPNCGEICAPEKAALVTQCGGTQEVEWASFNEQNCTGICLPTCGDAYDMKVADCGGSQYLKTWDMGTCKGTCYCEEIPDNKQTPTYRQLEGFCSGSGGGIKTYNKELCEGDCKSCDEEFAEQQAICLQAGTDINRNSPNAENCVYNCLPNCQDEYDAQETACGFWGVDMSKWNEETCSGPCKSNCENKYAEFESKCGIAGVATWDDGTCSGTCKDCDWSAKDCTAKCAGQKKDSVDHCTQNTNSSGVINVIEYGNCECNEPSEPWGDTVKGGEPGTVDPSPFGVAGQAGGTVEVNPDGSKTETLTNGTKITYSKDGQVVQAKTTDGRTLTKRKENGVVTNTIVDSEGNVRIQVLEKTDDGQIKETITNGDNINSGNPELSPQIILGDSVVTYYPDSTTPKTDIGGTDIPGKIDPELDTPTAIASGGCPAGTVCLGDGVCQSGESLTSTDCSGGDYISTRSAEMKTNIQTSGMGSMLSVPVIPSGGSSSHRRRVPAIKAVYPVVDYSHLLSDSRRLLTRCMGSQGTGIHNFF